MILPDVLEEDLEALLCGSAAGAVSARVGLPYAGPGNRFWRTLHEVGLTARLLDPGDFRELPRHGLGLTDLCKTASGADADLPAEADDLAGLLAKVERWRPRRLAFVGKRAATVALDRPVRAYGRQPERPHGAVVWVLPSTSGLAVRFWDIGPWRDLAEEVRGA